MLRFAGAGGAQITQTKLISPRPSGGAREWWCSDSVPRFRSDPRTVLTRVIAVVAGTKTQSDPNASDEPPRLPQNTRVRLTALGEVRCPNLAGREGVVVGSGRYRSTVRVIFDGFKSATSLHNTYIEAVLERESSNQGQTRR